MNYFLGAARWSASAKRTGAWSDPTPLNRKQARTRRSKSLLLNRYFEGLANAVLAEDGPLDEFTGDALMAKFGVPRSRGERQEALTAARAALAMQPAQS